MVTLSYFALTNMVTYDYIATMKQHRTLKTCNVIFRLTESELERIDRLAVLEDRSRSQILRRLVAEGLQRHEPPKLVANGDV